MQALSGRAADGTQKRARSAEAPGQKNDAEEAQREHGESADARRRAARVAKEKRAVQVRDEARRARYLIGAEPGPGRRIDPLHAARLAIAEGHDDRAVAPLTNGGHALMTRRHGLREGGDADAGLRRRIRQAIERREHGERHAGERDDSEDGRERNAQQRVKAAKHERKLRSAQNVTRKDLT